MKKQIKKLSLNKRTISNLNTVEMNQKVGGTNLSRIDPTFCRNCDWGGPTQKGRTCNGNNNCV